jgi:uncharacterized protein YciI
VKEKNVKEIAISYFAVFGEYGATHRPGAPLDQQPAWRSHAEFMDGLALEGIILLAGPLGDGDSVLLIGAAESAVVLEECLSQDPWRHNGMLRVPRIEPWDLHLGDLDRLRVR